ncbi:MAG: Nif11-like leader peptide family natural product precursor [Tatlockia sp.]|nr:Nif11-like leader peptide family natural product precursor [Tatlockia sp.]
MSQADIQRFYDMVQSNQQMQEQLKATENKESFKEQAVQLGQQNGMSFTSQEAEDFLNQRQSQASTPEMTDTDLENVAGGKARGFTVCILSKDCWGSVC